MSLIAISHHFTRRSFLSRSRCLIWMYLTTAIALIGFSELFLYFFIVRKLEQQSNHELLTLVELAAPSLDIVKTQGRQRLDQEIPWRNLFGEHQQSLEWFDSQGNLLAREGTVFLSPPLELDLSATRIHKIFLFKRWGQIRTVTIPVYKNSLDNPDNHTVVLEGYIRASESTQATDLIRKQLQWGLALGGTLALVLIFTTSFYLTQQALIALKQKLNKLQQITTDISHHLRTPLTRISIATELLLARTDKIQASDVRKLKIINDAVKQLKRFIEDWLFLIRIYLTSNLEELNFSEVSLNLLLETLKVRFEPLAHSKAIDFQIQLLDNIFIRGDRAKLTRLLTNLLENAFKYTESGGKVSLSVKRQRKTVIVSVQDTGIGISTQELPLIFQHFWRGELAKTKHPQGFGLGLTIADAVAGQHKGKIEVISQPGQGSCFNLHLRLS